MDRRFSDRPVDRLIACVPEVSNAHACPKTIGPAPMMRMVEESVLLGIFLGFTVPAG